MNSQDVREAWAERSGEFSPTYYAHRGADHRSEAVRAHLEATVGTDAAVLELGCSAGRHLAHLQDHGFSDLAGIEVNAAAFDVLEQSYPALAETATLHHATFEDALPEFPDDAFDAVFSVESIQHIHPDEAWVFEEIARVTGATLVTIENEGAVDPSEDRHGEVNYVSETVPLYYRNWERVFAEYGMAQFAAEAGDRDTIRAFRAPSVGEGR